MKVSRPIVLVACVAMLGAALPSRAADPAAAERQYRIARRLAAEGSREAADARTRRLRQLNLECIDVATGEPFVEPLVRFFRKREARR